VRGLSGIIFLSSIQKIVKKIGAIIAYLEVFLFVMFGLIPKTTPRRHIFGVWI